MTIICSDGITIAGDGRVISGQSHIAQDDFRKIVVRKKPTPRIYALAGQLALFEALIQWHMAGAVPEEVPKAEKANWEFLVIDRNGPVEYLSNMPYPCPCSYPLAIGLGDVYVFPLLDAGMTPEQAIKIACKREAHAGGTIQVVNISEALGLQPVREAAE